MEIWNEILGNQVLVCSVAGWTVAQVLKTIIDVVLNRSFNRSGCSALAGCPVPIRHGMRADHGIGA